MRSIWRSTSWLVSWVMVGFTLSACSRLIDTTRQYYEHSDKLADDVVRDAAAWVERQNVAGLTLEGAVVQQDDDSTRAIYGKKVPFRTVLSGKTEAPKVAAEFMRAVSAASRQARAAEAKEEVKQ